MRGEGVENTQNLVHVVCEWPLNKNLDYRALRTMIDLGRITAKCTDCPQVIPIAGDLTMNGENRHIYRLGYKGAQNFGAKVIRNSM